jgi:para-aminobenzoate synthetase component I
VTFRADDGIRTRDPHLGKVMRYQLRYVRVFAGDSTDSKSIPDTERTPASGTHHSRGRQDATVSTPALAQFGNLRAENLLEVSDDPCVLTAGRWAVAIGFEGRTVLARFDSWNDGYLPRVDWRRASTRWHSSLSRAGYEDGVRAVQEDIGRGWVYQVNLCRILSTEAPATHLTGLYQRLEVMRAGFCGLLELPDHNVHIASASPERFLSRDGQRIRSSPIKGTAATADGFLAKDIAENVMIVDLVRNDLGRVASTGSVSVEELLVTEPYPGLFHLVSTVGADVEADWSEILAATMPPGSVSGAPKHTALEVIGRIEPCARQWYCGAFGWIDVDTGRAELGVAIRTFWLDDGILKFGTGAGITWGSDPAGEWAETELKAQRLIALASGQDVAG